MKVASLMQVFIDSQCFGNGYFLSLFQQPLKPAQHHRLAAADDDGKRN